MSFAFKHASRNWQKTVIIGQHSYYYIIIIIVVVAIIVVIITIVIITYLSEYINKHWNIAKIMQNMRE